MKMQGSKKLKILLAGGGSGGPVSPLLAVAQQLRKMHPESEFLLVGTGMEVERRLAEQAQVRFTTIPAGKFRRYWSIKNIFAPFLVLAGAIKAIFIFYKFHPDIVFGAGGYVSVPVALAAFLLNVKIIIHQQDIEPSLTNKLVAPLAKRVTVTFEESEKDFYSGSGLYEETKKVIWTGNPIREQFEYPADDAQVVLAKGKFGIMDRAPVVLVLGGGTGAVGLNNILIEALPELTRFAHVIHSSGINKGSELVMKNYSAYPLIEDMRSAYLAADVVVCRAGLSTISEAAAMSKACVIMPMPESHQVQNALYLHDRLAAVLLSQDTTNGEKLVVTLKQLIYSAEIQASLKHNISAIMPRRASEKIAKLILDLCQK